MTDEIEGMEQLIPIAHVRFVWPETFSCTNEHFNAGLRRGDQHSVIVKTFYIDEPIEDLEDWTDKYFGTAISAETPKETFESYESKSVNCFLLMEMAVHQSETAHSEQKKKKSKEAEREEAAKEMKKKAEKAKARRIKRTASATAPDKATSS
jgi:hypothetical protein